MADFDDSIFDEVAGITICGKRYTDADLANLAEQVARAEIKEELAEIVYLRERLTQKYEAKQLTQTQMQKGFGILYARRVAANKKLRELNQTKPV